METWSNNACLGYAILAAKRMGLNKKQTQLLIESVKAQFDWKSVDEAADVYCDSPY